MRTVHRQPRYVTCSARDPRSQIPAYSQKDCRWLEVQHEPERRAEQQCLAHEAG